MLFIYLIQRFLHKLAFILPGGFSTRPWLHRLRGVTVGKNVWIAQFVYIDEIHPENVTIGDDTTIGLRTSIFTHFYWGSRKSTNGAKVVIGKNVFIGPHCVILPNVRIGEGAVIKAGSVVSRNVPAHAFWGPPPCEVLGVATVPLTAAHTYAEFVQGIRLRKKPREAVDDSTDMPV
jgi:acetyltransferase-like isoleucine patch superfamily enzyme